MQVAVAVGQPDIVEQVEQVAGKLEAGHTMMERRLPIIPIMQQPTPEAVGAVAVVDGTVHQMKVEVDPEAMVVLEL